MQTLGLETLATLGTAMRALLDAPPPDSSERIELQCQHVRVSGAWYRAKVQSGSGTVDLVVWCL
jgi:hypothetical protein